MKSTACWETGEAEHVRNCTAMKTWTKLVDGTQVLLDHDTRSVKHQYMSKKSSSSTTQHFTQDEELKLLQITIPNNSSFAIHESQKVEEFASPFPYKAKKNLPTLLIKIASYWYLVRFPFGMMENEVHNMVKQYHQQNHAPSRPLEGKSQHKSRRQKKMDLTPKDQCISMSTYPLILSAAPTKTKSPPPSGKTRAVMRPQKKSPKLDSPTCYPPAKKKLVGSDVTRPLIGADSKPKRIFRVTRPTVSKIAADSTPASPAQIQRASSSASALSVASCVVPPVSANIELTPEGLPVGLYTPLYSVNLFRELCTCGELPPLEDFVFH